MLPLQGGASLIPGGGTKIPHAEWRGQNKERRKGRLSGSPECKTDEAETGLWLGHGHICQEPLPSYPSQHPFSPPAPPPPPRTLQNSLVLNLSYYKIHFETVYSQPFKTNPG